MKSIHQIFLESLIAITIISYMKPSVVFDPISTLKNTVILTLILLVLEWYDSDLCEKARTSMFYSVGTCFF